MQIPQQLHAYVVDFLVDFIGISILKNCYVTIIVYPSREKVSSLIQLLDVIADLLSYFSVYLIVSQVESVSQEVPKSM